MSTQHPSPALEQEIKELIVSALMLDDVDASSISSEAPLFNEGLGLDSIDALELAVALERHFGVKMKADDESNRKIFGSVRALATHLAAHGVSR